MARRVTLQVDATGEAHFLASHLTPATVAARHPVPEVAHRLFGKSLGASAYLPHDRLARLCQPLVELLTPLRTHSKPPPLQLLDLLLVRKRGRFDPFHGVAKGSSEN